jgi:hypothetical protein
VNSTASTSLNSPSRHPSSRQAGSTALDREAVFLQQLGQVARGLDFMEAELAKAEQRIVDLLGKLGAALDPAGGLRLEPGERRRRWRYCGQG